MMAHIMERYFTNTEDQEVPDRMCEGTLKAIITEALRVMKEPENYGARANLMWAGTIAHNGTCGVGAVEDWASHFMEHEVSAVYNVTHGAGLAGAGRCSPSEILLPCYWHACYLQGTGY